MGEFLTRESVATNRSECCCWRIHRSAYRCPNPSLIVVFVFSFFRMMALIYAISYLACVYERSNQSKHFTVHAFFPKFHVNRSSVHYLHKILHKDFWFETLYSIASETSAGSYPQLILYSPQAYISLPLSFSLSPIVRLVEAGSSDLTEIVGQISCSWWMDSLMSLLVHRWVCAQRMPHCKFIDFHRIFENGSFTLRLKDRLYWSKFFLAEL